MAKSALVSFSESQANEFGLKIKETVQWREVTEVQRFPGSTTDLCHRHSRQPLNKGPSAADVATGARY